ncbi:MAG: hypothetical protein H0U74_19450 [Bradymonadaceae bacterium]|nr:hypothetical protein [Lujinxingiaceae bacterium]
MTHTFRKSSPSQAELTPQTFADSLRHGEQPHLKLAYDRLLQTLRSLAGHPQMRGLRGSALDERLADLAQDYCAYLIKNPRALAAASVKHWGAVGFDLRRFLDRNDKLRHGHEEAPMRRHLWRKIHKVMRDNPAFTCHSKRLSLTARSPVTTTDGQLDLDVLRAALPALESVLDSGSDNRCPEIVKPANLEAHLIVILERANRALTLAELCDLCWSSLRPPPVCSRIAPGDDALDLAGEVSRTPDSEINAIAAHFIDGLSERARLVCAHRFSAAEPSARQIAEHLDISHGTVGNEYTAFNTLFGDWVKHHQLCESEAGFALERILDILRADAFHTNESKAPATVGDAT